MLRPWLPVQGTWGWGRGNVTDWWQADSPFVAFLLGRGLVLLGGNDPFVWTTNLDGARLLKSRHVDWECGGINLRQYLKPPLHSADADLYVPYEDRNLISHSHGLQAVLYAAASGLRIRRLVSVTGPVRDDMLEIAKLARPNIAEWWHVHSDHSDTTQWLGALLDGRFGIVRAHPLADKNIAVGGVGHSGLLHDPAHFRHWIDTGLVGFLTAGIDGA